MIDDVLEELQAAGEVDSEGEFTLDRAKAREKLRRFQLADPRAYVLELVQAAALKGATWATFTVDSRDMVMEHDGRPFTLADFDDVYGAALSRRRDPDVLARRQLAIGVGSAMALRPRFIAVESGDGQTGARLLLRPDAPDELGPLAAARVGTRIHVRERFTMSTFAAFFRNLAGTLAEEQLLRTRCTYASFGIGLEGARLDRGLTLEDEPVLDEVEVEQADARARCGLRPDGSGAPRARIIKDGVWIVDAELPTAQFSPGFVAVVQDAALRKDVSQSDIVRDEAFEAMVEVLRAGQLQALERLAERMVAGSAPEWAERALLRRLAPLVRPGEVGRLAAPLRRVPLWKATDGRALCLEEIVAEAEACGSVGHTAMIEHEGLLPRGLRFVVKLPVPPPPRLSVEPSEDALRRTILSRALDSRLVDVTPRLTELVRHEHARRAFRARKAAPVLPAGAYLCRRALAAPGVRGELGIVAEPTDRAALALVVDGCLLVELRPSVPWLGLRMVVEGDGLEPHGSFERVVPSVAACTAVLRAALEIPALYGELAGVAQGQWRDACAMSFLESALRSDSLALVLGALQADAAATDAAVRALGGEVRLRLDPGLAIGDPHPTVGMPLFRTLGRRCPSLLELVERARQGERLLAVPELRVDVQADVLVLGKAERVLVQRLLATPITDGTAEVTRLVRERAFMARPLARRELVAGPSGVCVPVQGEGITGVLRVIPAAGIGVRTVEVHHRGRRLDALSLVLVGEIEGWVESTAIVPAVDYKGVQDGEAVDLARAAVLRAFAAACLQVAERSRQALAPADAAFLVEVLALAFPSVAMRTAYEALVEAAPDQALALYQRIYAAVHRQGETGELARRIARVGGSRSPVADAEAVAAPSRDHGWALAAVDVLWPAGQEPPHALSRRVLRPVAPLGELPLLSHHDGRGLSLATIRALVEAKQTLLHVSELSDVGVPDRTIACVDAPTLTVLRRLVTSVRLLDGRSVVAQALRRRELDARAKVDRVALPAEAALVAVRLEAAGGTPRRRPAIEGEVGLTATHPGNPYGKPTLRLSTFVEHAWVEDVVLGDRGAELVAAANDDRLTLTPDHRAVVRDKVLDELALRCLERVPALVTELAARWRSLAGVARMAGWYHLLDFMMGNPAVGSLDALAAAAERGDAMGKAAKVPGFRAVGGAALSLGQLVEAHVRNGRIDVLPAPPSLWGESPLPPTRPVVCVDPYELDALYRMLPQVESLEATWSRLQEGARQRAAAPLADRIPSARLLVVQEVVRDDLQGRLAIPVAGQPLTIELCAEGRVIAARRLEGVLPCWGSVSGPSVQPDSQWADATVSADALEALRLRSYKLYGKLARWASSNEEHPEHTRVASMLALQVTTLCRAERAGPLPEPLRRLFEDLQHARVLALPNGRRINLHKALEERPDALSHLDLWDSPAHRLQRTYVETQTTARPPAPAPTPAPAPVSAPVSVATPKPTPRPTTPKPTPRPPTPAPPTPTPEERLLDALRAELSLVRQRSEALLSNEHLDRLQLRPLVGAEQALVAQADRRGVIVNREHPVVRRALAEPGDPVWCTYVASAVYTALNVWLAEITDADERTFLEQLAEIAGSA